MIGSVNINDQTKETTKPAVMSSPMKISQKIFFCNTFRLGVLFRLTAPWAS
jgi:hypothetical protein